MSYDKRFDNRKKDELRPISIEVGVLEKADGSAMFQIGNTKALCAVYGPRALHPKFLRMPDKALLRCKYDMLSFSVTERKRPGPTRRSLELGMIIKSALQPAVMTDDFPNSVIDVFIDIIQADAGTRCAAISAASLALADAGVPMKDLVSAVAVGKVSNAIVLDLNKKEEDHEEGVSDIPIAYLPKDDMITLIQLDGNISAEDLNKAIKLGIKGCKKIHELQVRALKKRYQHEKEVS